MTSANAGAAGQDDFIPAPDATEAPVNEAAETSVAVDNMAGLGPIEINSGIGQTELILAFAALAALAGLLLILKNVIRKSLIAGRATIDAASAAGWTWYLSLLIFGALIIAGIAGGLFDSNYYIGLTAAVLVVGVLTSLMMTSRARRSA